MISASLIEPLTGEVQHTFCLAQDTLILAQQTHHPLHACRLSAVTKHANLDDDFYSILDEEVDRLSDEFGDTFDEEAIQVRERGIESLSCSAHNIYRFRV